MCGVALQKHYDFETLIRAPALKGWTSPESTQTTLFPILNDALHVPAEYRGHVSLFILAGQSNMSGRGQLPPKEITHPRVFLFGNNYRWTIAREPIDDPTGQVDEVSKDDDAGVGPGLAFAISLLKRKPKMLIGLIPCAKGSSSIQAWQRNLSDNTLYGSCLKRIRAASTMGKIVGMLFFQGESDALDPKRFPKRSPSAFSYATKFASFVDDLRKDVSLLNMPVIFAQLGSHKEPHDYVNWNIVKEQQRTSKLVCALMITTDDLALADELHFTTESYRIVGERFVEAYLRLTTLTNDCLQTR
jgi:hypothetical protein